MILHTLNKAPGQRAFHDCLALLQADHALLLLGNGVYAALQATPAAKLLAATGAPIYVLEADALAAGIVGRLMPGATLVDDDGFVELSERFSRQLAWY